MTLQALDTLSSHLTSQSSKKFVPMKPAPPVTRIMFYLPLSKVGAADGKWRLKVDLPRDHQASHPSAGPIALQLAAIPRAFDEAANLAGRSTGHDQRGFE